MRRIQIAFSMAAFLFLTGCVSKAQIDSMSVPPQENIFKSESHFDKKFKNNISILSVSGGTINNLNWDKFGTLTNDNFKSALLASLQNQKLYSKFGQYQISADLIKFELIGSFDSEISLEVEYQLINNTNKKVILRKRIITSNAMTFREEIIGAVRYRRIAEGSVKRNIEKLLVELSKIDINNKYT